MNQLADWRVTEVRSESNLTVLVDFPRQPTSCLRCGSARTPRRYGALATSFKDAPFLGKQVTITVNAQRFRCADCGQAFFQEFPDMDDKRRMTARCANYIIDQVMARSSMRDVAKIVGIDEKGARNIFEDRGLIFSVGDSPGGDRFVCESCLGIHRKSEHRLAPAKHFGRWRSVDLQREANVCKDCFDFASDPWRAGVAKRSK